VAWYAGIVAGAFVLLGALLYAGLRLYLEQTVGAAQTRRAEQIADTLVAHVDETGEAHVVSEINSWFAPETNDRFIRITRKDGSVLYLSHSPRDMSFDAGQVLRLVRPVAEAKVRKEDVGGGKRLLIAAVPGKPGGGFVVEVGASLEPVEAVLHHLIVLLAGTLAVLMIVATIGGNILVRKSLSPVDRIARSAEQITLHNLKERLPIAETGDELQRLSVSLNQMIARLDDAFQHNRRFTADASHELRTPLTVLRGELESMVEDTKDNPEVQSRAASVLEEAERLARVVEGLFAVSRLDAGEAQKESMPFDLAGLAASTAEQMCLLAEDKGITVSCHAPQSVEVRGDRARMKQVIVNLLDNAIKYTQPGGAVRLSVASAAGKAVLEVEDNGIGIPAEAQPHIFERFFRVDEARSREVGGAGLGLSIVKSICAAHGGRVEFRSSAGAGSRFRVELPLRDQPTCAEK
jgi:heavy metal sensor kinase